MLGYIRRPEDIDAEIADIQRTAEIEEQAAEKTSWSSLFNSKYRYLVIAGVGVAAFQQFQGANAIFYYIPQIVGKAGNSAATDALFWPIINGIILVVGSLVYIAIAEKFNRRTLLTVGGTVMGLSFLLPSLIHAVMPTAPGMLIVVFLCIYVAFYSFTWAPLTWVLVGEGFPPGHPR